MLNNNPRRKESYFLKQKGKQKVRFVPLGGITGVTKNMYLYEFYNNNKLEDILIIDCGIGFTGQEELGINFVIPDISYLQNKIDKIRGIILSHAHEDHISALPFYYNDLGRPPIFTTKLTKVFLENKFKEAGVNAEINQIKFRKDYSFGAFTTRFIRATHSIPDSMHTLLKSPIGNFYHGQDFKLDITPPYGNPPDFYEITKAGEQGVLSLMSDCLGAEREGLTLSEKIVGKTFEDEMRTTKGKFIMTTFSSNISRIRQCVDAAIKFNRKVVFLGRSMQQNSKAAQSLGYLPTSKKIFINEQSAVRLPPHKLCIIAAGSQGQFGSALSKLARKQNKYIKITRGDKIVFSSDPIPGNESNVYSLIEEFTLQGAQVKYSDIQDLLHASGHGNQEDLKFMARFINPKFFIPIGGTIRHQRQYQNLMEDMGFNPESVFILKEGETVWFEKNKAYLGEKIKTKNIYVDSNGIRDVNEIVLKERKTLSRNGIALITILINQDTNTLKEDPDVQLFGISMSNNSIIQKIKDKIKTGGYLHQGLDKFVIQKALKKELLEFFIKKLGNKPLLVVKVILV